MSVCEQLLSESSLQEYREHYLARHSQKDEAQAFSAYFDGPRFSQQLSGLMDGSWNFSIPEKKRINAKRVYFVYPKDEVLLMGFLNFVLHRSVADALPNVQSRPETQPLHCVIKRYLAAAACPGSVVLKGDIKNITDTVRRDVFLKVQERLLADDPQALDLLRRIYGSGEYFEEGEIRTSPFHLFMGTPLDSYSNNTVLYELDCACQERALSYLRFYDDFALVLDSKETATELLSEIKKICESLQLQLHPQKSKIIEGSESYEFLGLNISGGEAGIAKSTLDDIRKQLLPFFRAMLRMVRRGQMEGTAAMLQVIHIMQGYFASDDFKQNLLPLLHCLTSDADIRHMDHATLNWIRAIGAGTSSGAKYRIRYEQIQALGYKSLVGLYYSYRRR